MVNEEYFNLIEEALNEHYMTSDMEKTDIGKIDIEKMDIEKTDFDVENIEKDAPHKPISVKAQPAKAPEVTEGALPQLDEHRANLPWYVVHTYSGFEHRAKDGLEERIRMNNLTHKFGNIVVPQETVVELVKGVKKTSSKKFLPGYILVQVELDDNTWHLIKDTPRVTGFVGNQRDPLPLTKEEIGSLLQQIQGGAEKPKLRVKFEQGDSVKVVDGPFVDFNGVVDEVKPDKGKLRVLISIFGRNTPVELDFMQVEKV